MQKEHSRKCRTPSLRSSHRGGQTLLSTGSSSQGGLWATSPRRSQNGSPRLQSERGAPVPPARGSPGVQQEARALAGARPATGTVPHPSQQRWRQKPHSSGPLCGAPLPTHPEEAGLWGPLCPDKGGAQLHRGEQAVEITTLQPGQRGVGQGVERAPFQGEPEAPPTCGSESRPRPHPDVGPWEMTSVHSGTGLKCPGCTTQPLKAARCCRKSLALELGGLESHPSSPLSCCVASGESLHCTEPLVPVYVLEQ